MKKLFLFSAIITIILTVCPSCQGRFSKGDKAIINTNPQELMHILVVDNPEEDAVLRAKSGKISRHALKSDEYKLLAARMNVTVQDSTVGGVGIAGPQVGINKRIVVVQRFDKPGEPFEAYPNIQIISYSDDRQLGFEGCLSVPNRREQISRSQKIVISYTDPTTFNEVQETVEGFTAVIFQHETDHLEGIIYTDRL